MRLNGWSTGAPLRLYLLTEEQFNLSGGQLLGADLVKLGEVAATEGETSFEFTLKKTYRTEGHQTLDVQAGQRLYVMAAQTGESGSNASRTGPLRVR